MRTTIEMKDEHRAKLLGLAAERGEKGFSGLVEEALDAYLKQIEEGQETRDRALALRGSLTRMAAGALEHRTHELRGTWR